jgi:hypothetical protein
MTENSKRSPYAERTKTTNSALLQVQASLREKGIKIDDLAVVNSGGDILLGETNSEDLLGTILLKNPKRIMVLKQMGPGGLSINYMVGDLDFMSSGVVQVNPNYGYWLNDMDEEGQIEMLRLLLQFFDRRAQSRAVEAGLVLPGKEIVKR